MQEINVETNNIEEQQELNPIQEQIAKKDFYKSEYFKDTKWHAVKNAKKYRSNRQYPSKNNGDVYVHGGEISWHQISCKCGAIMPLIKPKDDIRYNNDKDILGEYACPKCIIKELNIRNKG